jgi:hypothetical protein
MQRRQLTKLEISRAPRAHHEAAQLPVRDRQARQMGHLLSAAARRKEPQRAIVAFISVVGGSKPRTTVTENGGRLISLVPFSLKWRGASD